MAVQLAVVLVADNSIAKPWQTHIYYNIKVES